MTNPALTPQYNACDGCGRNAHRVAVHAPRPVGGWRETFRGQRETQLFRVFGYCPGCFADYAASDRPVFYEGSTVVYDRRAPRTQAQVPSPLPAYESL